MSTYRFDVVHRVLDTLGLCVGVALIGGLIWGVVGAQTKQTAERPPQPPAIQQWQLASLPTLQPGEWDGRVDVIDTPGVCLYVARMHRGNSASVSLIAVPKSQLKPGVGCQ